MSLLLERIKRSAKNKALVKKVLPEKQEEKNFGATMVLRKGTPSRGVLSNSAGLSQMNGMSEAVESDINSKTITKKPGKYQIDWDYVGPSPFVPDDFVPPVTSNWTESDQLIRECDAIIADVYKKQQDRRERNAKMSASSLKNFSESIDASTTLDAVVTQVASANMTISIAALAQLDELLKDPSKSCLLAGRIDQLFQSLYFQYRMAYNTHMVDSATKAEDVVRLYRNLSMVLLMVRFNE